MDRSDGCREEAELQDQDLYRSLTDKQSLDERASHIAYLGLDATQAERS